MADSGTICHACSGDDPLYWRRGMKQLLLIICVGAALVWSGSADAQKRVLLVQSYHEGYPWVDAVDTGVREGFEGSGVQLQIFYMDTKRNTGEQFMIDAGNRAKELVNSFRPDVVITVDDNAQTFFAEEYAGKTSPQIVFCGVNAEPEEYGFPASNATGLLERIYFRETVDMLKTIYPNINTIAVISDDSATSDAMVDYIKTQPVPVTVTAFDQVSTFDEWKARIQSYQGRVDAIAINTYQTLRNRRTDTQSIDPQIILDWTFDNITIPTAGFLDTTIQGGALCGVATSGEEHGYEAAHIALDLMDGHRAAEYPVRVARQGMVMLNCVTAEALNADVEWEMIETADQVIE